MKSALFHMIEFYKLGVEAILQVSIRLFEIEAKVTSMNPVDVSRASSKEPEKPDNLHKIAVSNPLETPTTKHKRRNNHIER
ncbi:MAG: hypothetical protein QW231_03405 [Candidatus Bathyarchaeia archaeon]